MEEFTKHIKKKASRVICLEALKLKGSFFIRLSLNGCYMIYDTTHQLFLKLKRIEQKILTFFEHWFE